MIGTHTPRGALVLGYAGLLPALAAALLLLVGPAAWTGAALQAHLAYAAIILSFIGGLWWGAACADTSAPSTPVLVASVVPPLVAWALALAGGPLSLVAVAVLFLAVLPIDRHLTGERLTPAWWLRLRVPLSAGMALLAIVSASASASA